MAGEVEVIAKIIPKNSGFTGLVDASQVIGGASNVLLAAAMPGFTGGDVTSSDGSLVLTVGSGKITNAMLAGSIATSKLASATTVGGNFLSLTNPSAITFPRINADNTVSALSASAFLTAIGGGAGTVTSVALTLPAIFSVSGSPITTSGTLAATLATQSANLVWAGPTTGAAATPTFRSLVSADLPSHTHTASQISDSTTVGQNFVKLTNPSAITFVRINADNSVSTLDASTFRTAIGAGTSSTTGTVTSVGITAPAAGITSSGGPITTSGSITLALANDLAAVEGLASNGVAVRTATDTWTTRTITGTANKIDVSNGDGVSGNPTLTISATYVGQTSITTLGTIATGTWQASTVAVLYGGTGATTASGARTNLGLGTIATQDASAVAITGGSITGMSSPTGSSDVATKGYVDGLIQGLKWKNSVRVATTANGTLATAFQNASVIDGVTLATGDRILLKNQSTAAENGIYTVAASGAPTRATDADAGAELVSAAVFVEQGTANADKAFVCTNDSITLGSTSITFVGFASTLGLATVATSGLASDLTGTLAAAQLPAHTGDVTSSAGSAALSIGAGVVTNTMLAGSIATSKLASATTVGGNFLGLTNPSAITFPRINADNSVSALDAATFRTAIGAGTSSTTGTVTSVGITAPAAGIGVSGSPITTSGSITLSLANDLSALEGLASTGIASRTATDTWAVRTITGTASEITVTNGDGVSGNPTLSLPAAIDLSGKTSLKIPVAAGAAPTTSGLVAYDSTANKFKGGANGSTLTLASESYVTGLGYITGNQSITLSGDVSGTGTTAITTTIGAGKVTNAMLAGSVAASKLVGTDIATVGTITSGTWQGTAIASAYLGTHTHTASQISDSTTVGQNLVKLTNPGAVTFVRINADNTVTARSAADFKTDLSLNNVENTALSTWAGSTNVTTLGTIATGTWQGTAVATGYVASTLTGKALTGVTSLGIRSTGAAFDLTIASTEVFTAGRTLTISLGDAARTLTMAGNATISGTNTGDQTITLTGDVTGSGTGSFAATIGAGKVTNSMLAGSIAASKLVGTDIATVGTITSGTWNGTAIATAYVAATLTGKALTGVTSLGIRSTGAAFDLTIASTEVFTAGRTLTISLGDAARTLTMAGNATISGTNTGDQTITLTGDVTGSGTGSFAATIASNAVTYAKLQDVSATRRVIGRNTAGSGDPEEVTASQVIDWIGSTRGSVLYRGAAGWASLTPGTSGYVLQSGGAGADPSWVAAGTGSVTTVSVASANGFAGSVANATTTPAITISTSVTGMLKGNGTAISAATAGTDYQAAITATGILKGAGSGSVSAATAATDYLRPQDVPFGCDCRLSTESQISTTNRTSQGTIYLVGTVIVLKYGSSYVACAVPYTGVSIAVSGSSGQIFDVWASTSDGINVTLSFSSAWTNSTTRAQDLAIDRFHYKSGDETKRYVGTICLSGTNVTEDSTSRRYVWSMYNRRSRPLNAYVSTSSWTYGTSTWRRPNGGSATPGTNQVAFVIGLNEDIVDADLYAVVFGSTSYWSQVGIVLDWSSGGPSTPYPFGAWYLVAGALWNGFPGIGSHTLDWIEYATGSTTFYGNNTGAPVRSGLVATIRG